MGICTSKNQIYNNPSQSSENVINLYKIECERDLEDFGELDKINELISISEN